MRKILVGGAISEKCLLKLNSMGYDVIKLPCFKRLQPQVAFHADMLVFYTGKELLTHEEYYLENKQLFDALEVPIILTSEKIGAEYPNDILLNSVLTSRGELFSKIENTSTYIKKNAAKLIDVKQGYTACSTCRVAERAFITSDKGLSEAFRKEGIDTLTVDKKGIELPGYDCGFIGGASVTVDNYLCFFGDLKVHPDYEAIRSFALKYGVEVVCLSDEILTDIGGGVVI